MATRLAVFFIVRGVALSKGGFIVAAQLQQQHLLTIGRFHHLFALLISLPSVTMTHKGAGAEKEGEATNGKASGRDILFESRFSLAPGILGRIKN